MTIAISENSRADFSANCVGIIGDSADKRFTFVRSDYVINDPAPPEYILIIDWKAGDVFWRSSLPTFAGAEHP